jgi:hypothetical protein
VSEKSLPLPHGDVVRCFVLTEIPSSRIWKDLEVKRMKSCNTTTSKLGDRVVLDFH